MSLFIGVVLEGGFQPCRDHPFSDEVAQGALLGICNQDRLFILLMLRHLLKQRGHVFLFDLFAFSIDNLVYERLRLGLIQSQDILAKSTIELLVSWLQLFLDEHSFLHHHDGR